MKDIEEAAVRDLAAMFRTLPKHLQGKFLNEIDGRSTRDWFAGQAMRAIIETDEYCYEEGRKLLAANCYLLADSMMAEREKSQ